MIVDCYIKKVTLGKGGPVGKTLEANCIKLLAFCCRVRLKSSSGSCTSVHLEGCSSFIILVAEKIHREGTSTCLRGKD